MPYLRMALTMPDMAELPRIKNQTERDTGRVSLMPDMAELPRIKSGSGMRARKTSRPAFQSLHR